MAKLVTCFGSVYRLSDVEYKAQLINVLKGNGFLLDRATLVGTPVMNVTDITEEMAEEALKDLSKKA